MQARNLAEDFLTLYHLIRQMVFECLTQHFDIPKAKRFRRSKSIADVIANGKSNSAEKRRLIVVAAPLL